MKHHSSCEVGKKYGPSGAITLEDCLDAFAKEEKIPEVSFFDISGYISRSIFDIMLAGDKLHCPLPGLLLKMQRLPRSNQTNEPVATTSCSHYSLEAISIYATYASETP